MRPSLENGLQQSQTHQTRTVWRQSAEGWNPSTAGDGDQVGKQTHPYYDAEALRNKQYYYYYHLYFEKRTKTKHENVMTN
jgi:hypothetical protein